MHIKIVARAISVIAAAAATSLTGCASIVSGTNQVMSVPSLATDHDE